MNKINDLDLSKWKESDIWTDSLWLISERDKSGKHDGFYHGNFIPQIPRQLIKRYTKKGDMVLDPFLGSGTTAFECETLNRDLIGIDIQKDLLKNVYQKLDKENKLKYSFIVGDSGSAKTLEKIKNKLLERKKDFVQLVILHPPYADIIKFSDHEDDLSNSKTLLDFITRFSLVLKNSIEVLENGKYLAIVIGDKYTKGQWIPLGFYCMNEAMKLGLTLKSIVIKDMNGNRAKQNKEAIWRYRALSSDYYIFKHEYVMIFKKN